MRFRIVAMALLVWCPAQGFALGKCSQKKVRQILEPATPKKHSVVIDCNYTFATRRVVITKKIHIRGPKSSGLTLNCNGGTIRPTQEKGRYTLSIYSTKVNNNRWDRIERVTVKNCKIYGRTKVYGMDTSGEGENVKRSSRRLGHTKRAQEAAPRYITFDNMTFIATGKLPLYFSPGVTRSQLINSEIKGRSTSAAMYLDAESGYNLIQNNYIHVSTSRREQLAVDGSAHNKIIGNRFSALNHGGIYLYRNCGEGGTVRHQTPSYNHIINNVFYYDRYRGGNPAIHIGSRNGWRFYCISDIGYKFGSSKSNKDYARHNVVADNQIYKRSVRDMIKQGSSPNYLYYNQTVSKSRKRKSGCFYNFIGVPAYVRHGDYAAKDHPGTKGAKYICTDGTLTRRLVRKHRIHFGCSKSNSNAGCRGTARCAGRKKLVSVRAACNLEWGKIDPKKLVRMRWNTLSVFRRSDRVHDGRCSVLGMLAISLGTKSLVGGIKNQRSFSYYCRERDKNGGDCTIRGEAYCL